MEEYFSRVFLKTLSLQFALLSGIYILYLLYGSVFLCFLAVPIVNIAYMFYLLSKKLEVQFGGIISMARGEDSASGSGKTGLVPFSWSRHSEPPAKVAEMQTKATKTYNRELSSFRKYILKKIIRPLVKNHGDFYKEDDENVENSSFQLDNSFIFDYKLRIRRDDTDKKMALCRCLTKNISAEDFEVLKKIARCGWIFYQKESTKHRMVMFNVLVNYFNFLMPSYESVYLHPFDEFVKRGPYGISFEGPLPDANFYFYSRNFVKKDDGNPIVAFLYLLAYCKQHFAGMLGPLSTNEFEFFE